MEKNSRMTSYLNSITEPDVTEPDEISEISDANSESELLEQIAPHIETFLTRKPDHLRIHVPGAKKPEQPEQTSKEETSNPSTSFNEETAEKKSLKKPPPLFHLPGYNLPGYKGAYKP